ncbi:MAG TPA: DUF397 domain-containing protein [Pseudonocardiaceae bacterium]|jgi:hypothetical protein
MTTEQKWFKSSHSSSDGSCVEVKFDGGAVLVRDSKDKRIGQPILAITAAEWRSFLTTVARRDS